MDLAFSQDVLLEEGRRRGDLIVDEGSVRLCPAVCLASSLPAAGLHHVAEAGCLPSYQ